MYTINAINHIGNTRYEISVLEYDYAITLFNTAIKCADCAYAFIIDAATGEIVREWESKTGAITVWRTY